MLQNEVIFLQKCNKLTDVIKDCVDIYYPNGIETGVLVNVLMMILVQTMLDNNLSDEDCIDIFKEQYTFYKKQFVNE